MTFDAHTNFAYSTISTAPSPASSGTSLTIQTGTGAIFPTPPFEATVWPALSFPLTTNAEIVRVTAIVGDVLTIVRAQESSTARAIIVGDQIAATITAKVITDIENNVWGIASGGTGVTTTPTAGALLIGTSAGGYAVNNLTAGTNISITNSSGSITINNTLGSGGVVFDPDSIQDVGATISVGSSGSPPHADHIHRGVHGIYTAPNTDVFGDVALVGSTNVTVTQSSGSFIFGTSGSFLPQVHDINGFYHTGFPLRAGNGGLGTTVLPTAGALPIGKSDGTYAPNHLIAGSGVTITNSSGSVTISASGTPGGSNTDIQYNDSGAFGGDANLTWNKTDQILRIYSVDVGSGADVEADRITADAGTGGGAGSGYGIVGGAGDGAGSGGTTYLTGGTAGSTGVGGGVNLGAGNGGAVSGDGGQVYVAGGSAVSGRGGGFTANGGNGTDISGNGNIAINSGVGNGAGAGGGIVLTAGASTGTGTGGYISLAAGTGGGTSGDGGYIVIQAGRGAAGNSSGGNISLQPGSKSGSGAQGVVRLYADTDAAYAAILDTNNIAASSKTFAFQNKSGTLALMSDIFAAPPFDTGSPADVGAAAVTGTSGSMSRRDHVHRGVHGIYVAPNTDAFGDILLVGSGDIAVTQSSGSFTFAGSSGSYLPRVHDINGQYHNGFPLRVAGGGLGTTQAPTSGALPIGTAGGIYVPNNLIAGTGIAITNSSGSITINSSGSTFGLREILFGDGNTGAISSDASFTYDKNAGTITTSKTYAGTIGLSLINTSSNTLAQIRLYMVADSASLTLNTQSSNAAGGAGVLMSVASGFMRFSNQSAQPMYWNTSNTERGQLTSSGSLQFYSTITAKPAVTAGIGLFPGVNNGTNFTAQLSPDSLSADRTFTFPNTSGSVVVGGGASTRVAYWSGANTLSSDAGFTYASPALTLNPVNPGAATVLTVANTNPAANSGARLTLTADSAGASLSAVSAASALGARVYLTTSGGYLLFGTNDANDIVFNTNNIERARLYSSGSFQNYSTITAKPTTSAGIGLFPGTNAGTNFTAQLSPDSLSADRTFTFPNTSGSIVVGGSSGSYVTWWTGTNTVGGSSNLTFDTTVNNLAITSSTSQSPLLTLENDLDDSEAGFLVYKKNRPTFSDGDYLGHFSAKGLIGGTYWPGATIDFAVDGSPASRIPTKIVFGTNDNGHNTGTALVLRATKNVEITSGVLLLSETSAVDTTALIEATSNSTTMGTSMFVHSSSGSTDAPYFALYRSRGTLAAPTKVVDEDRIGSINFNAYDGSAYQTAALIRGEMDINPTSGSMPGRLAFYTTPGGSTTPAERVRIDSGGNMFIGRTTDDGTGGMLQVAGSMSMIFASATGGLFSSLSSSSGSTDNSFLALRRSRGTTTSPTKVVDEDRVGSLLFQGYDGSAYQSVSAIRGEMDINPTSGSMPGRLTFYTTPGGSVTPAERMRITSAGNVLIGQTDDNGAKMVISGNASQLPAPIANTILHISQSSPNAALLLLDSFGSFPLLVTRRANNTATSPSALASNDIIGGMVFYGYGATGYSAVQKADILTRATQAWTDANQGTQIVFRTTPNSTTTITTALTIGQDQSLALANKITTYNNIATAGYGVPAIVAVVDLTAQGAAIAATTLYAVPAAAGGIYRISWYASVTRAATTSSTLGGANDGFRLTFTDPDDSVGKATPLAGAPAAGSNTAYSQTNAGNNTATVINGAYVINAKASTNIQYQIGYTSSGATTMQYNLHIVCERLS